MKKRSAAKRKRILAFTLILFSIIGAIWFYLANRFEYYVKNELLPELENHRYLIKTDNDLIKINKFTFSITTGEVVMFPNSETLVTKNDQLKIYYNPLKKQVIAYPTGNQTQVGLGDLAIYIDKPLESISFNRELLLGDFSDLDIKIKTKANTDIKDLLKNEIIFSADQLTFDISGRNNPAILDNYQLGLEVKGDKILYFDTDYYKRLNNFINASLDIKFNYFDSFKYSKFKEIKVIGALDVKNKYSIELKHNKFKSLILLLKDEEKLQNIIREFSVLEDIYFVNANLNNYNSAINNKVSFFISNDGHKISGNIDIDNLRSMSDAQKQELILPASESIYAAMLSEDNKFDKSNLSVEDFRTLATKLLEIKEFKVKLSGIFDTLTRALDHSFRIQVNTHNFEIEGKGKLKELTYDGNIKLSDPNKFIHTIVDLAESSIFPFTVKITLSNDNENHNERFKQVLANIKENGFKALSVLNKELVLNPGDHFFAELHFDPSDFEFKVNNKSFMEIITDERVIPFLKGMPKDKIEQQPR